MVKTMIKTPPKLKKIEQDLAAVRSFIIGLAGRDKEGEYHPEFVRRVLQASQKKPTYKFTNAKNFLEQLRKS